MPGRARSCVTIWSRPSAQAHQRGAVAPLKHVTHLRHLGRVERQRLIERRGFIKHAIHVRHLGRVERQRLIERCGIHQTCQP